MHHLVTDARVVLKMQSQPWFVVTISAMTLYGTDAYQVYGIMKTTMTADEASVVAEQSPTELSRS